VKYDSSEDALMKNLELDRIDTYSTRKSLTGIGSPIMPLTLAFRVLGSNGVTKLDWGIVAEALSAVSIELGYKVERVGRSIVLAQRKRNSVKEEGGRKPLETVDQSDNDRLELALGARARQ
jgi:hypothetical protein